MASQNKSKIPNSDEFTRLKGVVENVQRIINDGDFLSDEEKEVLIPLCTDAIYFLEENTPKLFVMYVSHLFRELMEKLFGEAKSIGENNFFNFDPEVAEDHLCALDDDQKFAFIEERTGHKIKIIGFIDIDERDRLIRISDDPTWIANVRKLNSKYGDMRSAKKYLGSKQFFERIPAKYSLSDRSFADLSTAKQRLYDKYSAYAHGSKLTKLVKSLEKDASTRSDVEQNLINTYIEDHTSIIDIFRPLETTTNDKIKELNKLINE